MTTRRLLVVSVLVIPATCRLICGRAVLVVARRWLVASRRTIWQLCGSQTYVFSSYGVSFSPNLTNSLLLSTGQRVGRGTRGAGSLRAVRSCHESFPCPGQRNTEGQGLCFYLLRRSFGRTACLRQDGRLYVLTPLLDHEFLSTNLLSLQTVTATSFSASSSPSDRLRFAFRSFVTTFLAGFLFFSGWPTSWLKLFSFVLYD